MVHTFEVLVDIKEYTTDVSCFAGTKRYEIDAETISHADQMAKVQARHDHPRATEYDIRVTRLLK
ncbi:MAG TPA: hypothetical protein V6C46_10595 [Coleofasciculaceae cyanobacterium]